MPNRSVSHDALSMAPAGPPPAGGRPIDFVHLARQSLGDRDLEAELLRLFERQAARIAGELSMPDLSRGARGERLDLAHTLKGSARAVGAVVVAQACADYEEALKGDCAAGDLAASTRALTRAVEEARALIVETLAA